MSVVYQVIVQYTASNSNFNKAKFAGKCFRYYKEKNPAKAKLKIIVSHSQFNYNILSHFFRFFICQLLMVVAMNESHLYCTAYTCNVVYNYKYC